MLEGGVGSGSAPGVGDGTVGGVGSAGSGMVESALPIWGNEGGIRSSRATESSEVTGVPLEKVEPGETPGRSNTRLARGSVVTRDTEASPAETRGPGTTNSSVSVDTNCTGLAVVMAVAARLGSEVPLHQLTDGVETNVRECEA